MVKEKFSISIDATREKVWDVLWTDATYREWTSAFSPSSNVETDWQEGSKVLFTDGSGSGMVSRIAEKRPNEYMAFEHLGELKDGVEDTTSEKIKAWKGAMECYTLTGDDTTELTVEIDLDEQYRDMFMDMFPKALQNVKKLSER